MHDYRCKELYTSLKGFNVENQPRQKIGKFKIGQWSVSNNTGYFCRTYG